MSPADRRELIAYRVQLARNAGVMKPGVADKTCPACGTLFRPLRTFLRCYGCWYFRGGLPSSAVIAWDHAVITVRPRAFL